MNLERHVIEFLQKNGGPENGLGIGDDAAYLQLSGEKNKLVIASDSLVEENHFSFKYCQPEDVAVKLVHVNASDLLCKGVRPRYALLNLQLSRQFSRDSEMLRKFLGTLKRLLKKYQVTLLGGDTTRSGTTCFSMTMLGFSNTFVSRKSSKIKAGDKVIMLGKVGGSSYALSKLLNRKKISQHYARYYTQPSIDIRTPLYLEVLEARAAIDQSDSLYEALDILAEENSLHLDIDLEAIQAIRPLRKQNWLKRSESLLAAAEDLAVIAIIPPEPDEKKLARLFKKIKNLGFIGEVSKKASRHRLNFYLQQEPMEIDPGQIQFYSHF